MFAQLNLLVAILASFASANFDGQVTSVQSFIRSLGGNFPLGTNPGQYNVTIGNPGDITANGVITNNSDNQLTIQSNDVYLVSQEPGDETHFQYVLDFSAVRDTTKSAYALGTNSDPIAGCLSAGILGQGAGFAFLLTNTKVYAAVMDAGHVWAIPIKNRIAVDVNTYTIVVKPDIRRVTFRVDNVNLVEVPGTCGIDKKFLVSGLADATCIPNFNDQVPFFLPQVLSIISVGKAEFEGQGFCQQATYSMCTESVSWANRCCCQYNTTANTDLFDYVSNIYEIDIFTVSRTNRCDCDSSSSDYHNWWSRPVKMDDAIEA